MYDFGWAIAQMHTNQKVRRSGWTDKFLILMAAGLIGHPALEDGATAQPYVAMIMPDGTDGTAVPYSFPQPDVLAMDWEIAE